MTILIGLFSALALTAFLSLEGVISQKPVVLMSNFPFRGMPGTNGFLFGGIVAVLGFMFV